MDCYDIGGLTTLLRAHAKRSNEHARSMRGTGPWVIGREQPDRCR